MIRDTTQRAAVLGLLAGAAALILAAASGVAGDAISALASPPAIVRAGLVGLSVVVGAWFLVQALRRMEASRDLANPTSTADIGTMLRGVRFVFLAAASFSAAIGWLVGHPLPIVIGLVIAGIDLTETSFLLLVAAGRGS